MIKVVNYIINAFIDFIYLFKRNKKFISGYIIRNYGKIEHNNWGDDINIFFFKSIFNITPLPKSASLLYKILPIKNYLCIGSVLGWYDNKHMEVWGSGLISPEIKIKKVRTIHSVRGPLTRECLLKQNVYCPEKYGDPALLISRFYKPNVSKKYKLGIIPHFIDFSNDIIQSLNKNPDILIIKMKEYNDWHDIPDQICSCDRIISSSLHGLIISDSYQIPNIWVKFSDNIVGGNFKFEDYYSSVGRLNVNPIFVNNVDDIVDLLNSNKFCVSENIDFDAILESCPFKNEIKENYNYRN